MKKNLPYLFIWILCIHNSCVITKFFQQTTTDIKTVHLLGTYEIPHNVKVDSTIVGGLSGIDYDAVKNLYYFISDDRSDKNPARFYTAHIDCNEQGIQRLQFIGVHYMLQSNGRSLPE
jgi:hypothetical protein